MKDILLLVHDDIGQEARLTAALGVTAALNGHLSCLDVIATPEGFYRMGGGPIAMMVLREEEVAERRNKSTLRARLLAKDISFSWNDAAGDLATSVIDAAGLADLLVLNTILSDSDEELDMAVAIRSILRRVSTPILAVPQKLTAFDAVGHALVLWDGSSDAQAALRATVPLLGRAAGVTIVYADDGSLGAPVGEATAYLRHQDIIATPVRREITGGNAARAIEHYIARHEPAYVVMGAFGHGRVHDTVFGSVTGHLLATSPAPLLLAQRA